jgi:hypothetical protein
MIVGPTLFCGLPQAGNLANFWSAAHFAPLFVFGFSRKSNQNKAGEARRIPKKGTAHANHNGRIQAGRRRLKVASAFCAG